MQQQMWGADAEALEALGRDMQVAATRLNTLTRQISAQLMGSPWDGADADRFRADWNRRYRGQMRSAADFLRQAHGRLVASGADQRQASADHGELAGMVAGAVAGMSAALGSVTAGWGDDGPGLVPDWARQLVTGMSDPDLAWDFVSEVFPAVVDLVSEADVIDGFAGGVLSGAGNVFGMFMGGLDLIYDHPYSGNFNFVEGLGDGLKIVGGALGLAGLIAGAVVAAPAVGAVAAPVAVVTGLGFISTGVGLGIDLALEGWDSWGRDVARAIGEQAPEVIDAVVTEIDERWDTAYETGRHALDDAGERVGEAAGAVGEAAGDVWETVTGGWPW